MRACGPSVTVDSKSIESYYNQELLPQLRQSGAQNVPLAEVTGKIKELLTQKKISQLLTAWLQNLRAGSQIRGEALTPSLRRPEPMSETGAKPARSRIWKYLLWPYAGGRAGAWLGVGWYSTTESFRALVRQRLIATLERTTGGRVELGSIHVVPFHFQVEVRESDHPRPGGAARNSLMPTSTV